jgi:UDP-N-acetylmuramoylalanine--D-glutamate ligase
MAAVLVVGLGVTGEAVARRLAASGPVVVVEDHPGGPGVAERAARLRALGVEVVAAPGPAELARLVEGADLVVPSPGVPESHPVYRLATGAGVALRSEIELAGDAARALGRTLCAVTGTNGKTTVTTLAAEMLRAGGVAALAAGNIGRPLLDAVHDEAEVIVAEVSSFQLRFTERFRPRVAVLLNAAEDHLDWHPDFGAYVAAKARIFANQTGGDLLVHNLDDEAVAKVAGRAPARSVGFSLRPGGTGYRVEDDGGDRWLTAPDGAAFLAVAELARSGPHDVANALAASAAVFDLGVSAAAVAGVLRSFAGLPHRVTPVGQSGGVTFVDDSKATNPHAALAALAGFPSVVLLAGGRNKGLDLGVLRREAGRIRAVVAMGEAAEEVAGCFEGLRPVRRAASMAEAVRLGAELALPGDTVLLSPACASFDWYPNYGARGDDFTAEVTKLIDAGGTS